MFLFVVVAFHSDRVCSVLAGRGPSEYWPDRVDHLTGHLAATSSIATRRRIGAVPRADLTKRQSPIVVVWPFIFFFHFSGFSHHHLIKPHTFHISFTRVNLVFGLSLRLFPFVLAHALLLTCTTCTTLPFSRWFSLSLVPLLLILSHVRFWFYHSSWLCTSIIASSSHSYGNFCCFSVVQHIDWRWWH